MTNDGGRYVDTLGSRLRTLRIDNGLSQDSLTVAVNNLFDTRINKGMISKWENDKDEPRIEYIKKLADFFQVTVNYLVGSFPFKNNLDMMHSLYLSMMENVLNHPDKPFILGKMNIVFFVKKDCSEEMKNEVINYVLNLINKFKNDEVLSDVESYELGRMIFSIIGLDSRGYGFFKFFNDEKRINFSKNYEDIRKVTLDVGQSLVCIDENGDTDYSEYIRYLYKNGGLVIDGSDDDQEIEDNSFFNFRLDKPEEIVKYMLKQPALMDFGNYNLDNFTEEDLSNLANDLLYALKLSVERRKQK
jgi:transcriptional regulator with XRE-family HTH domain